MSLQNIKTMKEERGFTLVELLIVIVIIAILAAITIVAYNGITSRAHNAAAKQSAQNVAAKAEAFNAENGYYPVTFAELNTGAPTSNDSTKTWFLPATSYVSGTPSASQTDDKTVNMTTCTTGSTSTTKDAKGVKVGYWDYGQEGSAAAVRYINAGAGC